MKLKTNLKIVIILYVLTALFWVGLVVINQYTFVNSDILDTLRHFTQIPLAIMPLMGGIIGLTNAFNWGGKKSIMGRGITALSLGLLTWGGGMIVWNYYLFFTTVEIPYPSLADAIFILSWPLWAYGLIQISKAIGFKYGLRNSMGKRVLFCLSSAAILFSIYLLFGVARDWQIVFNEGALKLFFDLFYPIGTICIITLVAVIYWISRGYLGGIYRNPIRILFCGFLVNYLADFTFSFTTTKETYFNGHFVDFLFTTAMFLLSIGVALLSPSLMNTHKDASK